MTHKVCLPQDTQLQQPVLLGRICLAPLGLGQPSMAAAHASPPAFPSATAPQIRLRGSCGAEIAIINLLCFAQRMRRKTIAFRGDHAKNNRAEAACPALEEPCGPGGVCRRRRLPLLRGHCPALEHSVHLVWLCHKQCFSERNHDTEEKNVGQSQKSSSLFPYLK